MEELFAKSIEYASLMHKISEDEMKVLISADKAGDELAGPEYEHYMKREFNSETPGILSRNSLLGLPVSKEYGGLDMPPIISVLVKERLGQLGMGISSFMNVQLFLCEQTIERWGSDTQKKEHLPKAVKGEKIYAFGLTEPEAGSDPASLRAEYKRDGSAFKITGTKYLISNGTISDHIIVFARERDSGKISAFIVDARSAGIGRIELREKIGLFTSDTGMIEFDDVEIPQENMIGNEGAGMHIAYSALLNARLGVAGGCVGIIDSALKASVNRARERIQHGKEIGKHQLIQQHISAIAQNLEMARWPTYYAAVRKQYYEKNPEDITLMEETERNVSLAKRIASRLAFESADRAVQIHGGFGYSLMSPVGQLFCDSRVARIYEGTDEIQDLKIASGLLGKGFEAYR